MIGLYELCSIPPTSSWRYSIVVGREDSHRPPLAVTQLPVEFIDTLSSVPSNFAFKRMTSYTFRRSTVGSGPSTFVRYSLRKIRGGVNAPSVLVEIETWIHGLNILPIRSRR